MQKYKHMKPRKNFFQKREPRCIVTVVGYIYAPFKRNISQCLKTASFVALGCAKHRLQSVKETTHTRLVERPKRTHRFDPHPPQRCAAIRCLPNEWQWPPTLSCALPRPRFAAAFASPISSPTARYAALLGTCAPGKLGHRGLGALKEGDLFCFSSPSCNFASCGQELRKHSTL